MKSPKSPLLPLLPTNYSSFSVLQRTIIFMSIKTNKHGISSCSKATQYGEQETTSQQKSRRQPLLPQLRIPQEDQIIQLSQICRMPRSVLCRIPGCWFSLCETLWTRLLSLWEFLWCPGPLCVIWSFFPSSVGYPDCDCCLVVNMHVFISFWMKPCWW